MFPTINFKMYSHAHHGKPPAHRFLKEMLLQVGNIKLDM